MKKLLVVVDMQNDFIDGVFGTKEAKEIVPNVVTKISEWDGSIILLQDTHVDYIGSVESRHLPTPHCIRGTKGWEINDDVMKAWSARALHDKNCKIIKKTTFGSELLTNEMLRPELEYVEFIGLCTDICVIANVLTCQSFADWLEFGVDSSCCAGSTPEMHQKALDVMYSCCVDVFCKRTGHYNEFPF